MKALGSFGTLQIIILLFSSTGSAFAGSFKGMFGPSHAETEVRILTAQDPDNFLRPPLADSQPLFARFTTQVHGTGPGTADQFGCKKFHELVASLDSEDISEFLSIGLELLKTDLRVRIDSWEGTESIDQLRSVLQLRSALGPAATRDGVLQRWRAAGMGPPPKIDSYGYPVIVLSASLKSAGLLKPADSDSARLLFDLPRRRAVRVEGRIQYQLSLRSPYLWHGVALDLQFFDGPDSLPLNDIVRSQPADDAKLLAWANDLSDRITLKYRTLLQATRLKMLGDINLPPNEVRLSKFGATAQSQWVALLASRCAATFSEPH